MADETEAKQDPVAAAETAEPATTNEPVPAAAAETAEPATTNEPDPAAAPAAADAAAVEPAEPTPPEDPLRRPLLDALQAELGEDLVGFELAGDDLWVRVNRSAWLRAGEVCRDQLGMTYFCFLSGIDWKDNPALLGEKEWDPERPEAAPETVRVTGVAGGDTRFQVFARLYNVVTHVGITLKADLDEDDPTVDSWVPLFRGADWHEREAWEMYGFTFDDHPSLRHLYLPSEFEGHPLRKDFPLLARMVKPWPGLVDVEPIPGDSSEESEAAEEG